MSSQSAIYAGQSRKKQQQEYPLQLQQQQFKQNDNQVEIQELRYEVYQDLQNTINQFYSLIGAIEYFQDDQNHPYITTATNKLISQLGISNSIHFEQQNNCQRNDILKLNSQKLNEKALKLFNEILANQNFPGYLNQYIQFFKGNLQNNINLHSIPLKPTKYNGEFNSNVLQKVINSINSTDNIYNNIRNGQRVPSPTKNSIQQTAEDYKRHTLLRLKANFPKEQNNNNKPSQYKLNPIERTSDIIIQDNRFNYKYNNTNNNKIINKQQQNQYKYLSVEPQRQQQPPTPIITNKKRTNNLITSTKSYIQQYPNQSGRR